MRTAFIISLLLPVLAMMVPGPLAPAAVGIALIIQSSDLAVIAAIIGAVVGPLVTFIIAARRFSGRIETTEASDLWEESRAIREWSAQRITILNTVVERLEGRVDELEKENSTLHASLNTLRAENAELRTRLENGVRSDQ